MTDEPVTSVTHDAAGVTVALHGEVDVLTVDQVRQALTAAIATRPEAIVVDLADLSFVDSTGLGALVFGFQRARDAGIALRLANPTRSVRQVLVHSGLLEVITLVEPGAGPAWPGPGGRVAPPRPVTEPPERGQATSAG